MSEYQKINADEEARPTYGGGGLFGLFEGEPPPKMSGWLNKQARGKSGGMFSVFAKGLKWDKRYFILDNQLIRYYEDEVEDINNKDFKGEVNLINAIIVSDVKAHTNGKTGNFIGISLDNGVTCELLLETSNAETCEQWREAIDKHIKAQVNIIKKDVRDSTSIVDAPADGSCCSCDCFSGWCSFLNCFDDDADPEEFSQWAQKFSRSRRMYAFLFRNWRKRYFVMKEGKITYYEFHENGAPPTGYKGFLSLFGSSLIEDASRFSNDPEGIYIGISLDHGSTCELLLKVDDEEKKKEWCTMLHRHIEFALANPTIANALPGEEVNTLGVFSDRLASGTLRSMNRLVNIFVNSAPRKARNESGFNTEAEDKILANLDREQFNENEQKDRDEAFEAFRKLVKKIKGDVLDIPTCFVFKEPTKKGGTGEAKEGEGNEKTYAETLCKIVQCDYDDLCQFNVLGGGEEKKAVDYKTSKDALISLLQNTKVSGKNICTIISTSPHEFVGGHMLTFIVVAWFREPLNILAKKQNQSVLMDETVLREQHEFIRNELKEQKKAADGSLLFSPDKYKLSPIDKNGKDVTEFEGVNLYDSAYKFIHTSYSMGKLLEDSLGGKALLENSDVAKLKKINLALDHLGFFFDDSIQNGQLAAYYPLHSNLLEVENTFNGSDFLSLPWSYDVFTLRNYFGEKIGYYFRFTQHYVAYLGVLALISTIMESYLYFSGASRGTPIAIYAGIVVFWGGLLMADWSYEANIQSYEWGMENYENVAIVRPQFKQTVVFNPNAKKDKELMELDKQAQKVSKDLEEEEKLMDSGILCTIPIPFLGKLDIPKLYCCWGKPTERNEASTMEEDASEDMFDGDFCGWIQFKISSLLLGGAETVRSPVDSVPEYVYRSQANHSLRKWIAFSVMVASVATVVASTFAVYYLNAFMSVQTSGFLAEYSAQITSFLNNAQTAILAPIFSYLMVVMNDFENHRTISAYNDALIGKKSCLVFINTFFSYYYIAFIAQYVVYDFNGTAVDASRSCGGYATCMDALCNNMFFAVLTDFTMLVKTRIETPIKNWIYHYYVNEFTEVADWIGKTLGLIQPLRPQKNILKKTADDLNNLTREVIKQYCHRASSGSYTGTHLFEDYTKLFVQFGYLMLFLPALPLVSVICFFTCWTDLKLDAQKLFDDFLRPFPEGSPDIGSWRSSFNYMAMAAVPTNAGVVVFTMNAFNTTSFSVQLIVFIGMQWVILVILYIAQAIYSGEALKVTVQRGRTRNIIQNLENLVGDKKLQKSDNQLRAQIAETERVTKLNAELVAKNKKLEQDNTRLRQQAK